MNMFLAAKQDADEWPRVGPMSLSLAACLTRTAVHTEHAMLFG